MKPKCRSASRFSSLTTVIFAGVLASNSLNAADGTWIQTAIGPFDWGTAANWSGSNIADGADFTALFTPNITANQVVNLDAARTIGNITFTDSGTSSNNLTISGANILTLDRTGGNTPIIDVTQAARTLTISSVIDGNAGLQKNGDGTLILGGNNTFTGGLNLNAGIIQYDSTSNANIWGDAANVITFTGNSTLYNSNNAYTLARSVAVNNGVTATLRGAFGESTNITGAVTGLGDVNISGDSNGWLVTMSNTANTLSGTIWVASNAGQNTILSVNSLADGAAGKFLKLGSGGESADFSLGAGTIAPVVWNNRQVQLAGTTGPVSIKNNATSAANSLTIMQNLSVTTAGAKTLTLGGSNIGENTFAGVIGNGSGTIAITKSEGGRWVLSNAANTYTGITTINGGILEVTKLADGGAGNFSSIGVSSSAAANLVLANTGTLRYTGSGDSTDRGFTQSGAAATLNASGSGAINFTNAATPAYGTPNQARALTLTGTNTGNNTLAAALTNNGTGVNTLTKTGIGTWVLSGTNSYSGATTLSGGGKLVLDYGTNDTTKLSDTGALTLTSGTLTLKSGTHVEAVGSTTIGPAASGGQVTINRDGGSNTIALGAITRTQSGYVTVAIAEDNLATTISTAVNGILTGGITVGSNWAKVGAGNNIVALTAGDYTALGAGAVVATTNYQLTGALTRGAATVNSLRIVGDGNNQVFDIGATALRVSPLSGVVAGTYIGNSAAGGLLYAGGGNDNYTITGTGASSLQAQNNNQELIINTFTGTLNLDVPLTMGSQGLAKTGAGKLVLMKASTYTGATYVNQGSLQLQHASGAGTTGAIVVQNGAALELASGISVGSKGLTITGTGVSNGGALRNVGSNTSSYAGAITLGAGGARINSDSTGALTLTGGITTSLFNDLTVGGAGNTTISTAAISGAGGLIKDGAGTTTLSATNTYTGATNVNGGVLAVNGSLANTTTTVGNTATLQGSGSILGSVTIQNGGTLASGNSIESLATGALGLADASTFAYELKNDAAALEAGDLTAVNGNLTLDTGNASILTLTELGIGSWAVNDKLTLISYSGTWNGGLFDYNGSTLTDDSSFAFSGFNWTFNYNDLVAGTNYTSDLTGTSFVTMTAVSVIPEPSTALLGALGVLALLRRRR